MTGARLQNQRIFSPVPQPEDLASYLSVGSGQQRLGSSRKTQRDNSAYRLPQSGRNIYALRNEVNGDKRADGDFSPRHRRPLWRIFYSESKHHLPKGWQSGNDAANFGGRVRVPGYL